MQSFIVGRFGVGGARPFFSKVFKIIMINFSRLLALINPESWSTGCQFKVGCATTAEVLFELLAHFSLKKFGFLLVWGGANLKVVLEPRCT